MLQPLARGCSMTIFGQPTCKTHWNFRHRDLPLADTYCYSNKCDCNAIVAIRNRCLQAFPPNVAFAPGHLRPMLGLARHLGRLVAANHRRVEFHEWGKRYTGRKLQRYLRAVRSLQFRPITPGDSHINAFVKVEKVSDPSKDPRVIQARSARFNVSIGCYLKTFEHKLYSLSGDGKFLPTGRLIAKGLSQVGRAYWLERHCEKFPRFSAFELDCSRWDAHVTVEALRVEHAVYCAANREPELRSLCSMQLRNRCHYNSRTCQIDYTSVGRRMSGDMNTALGNCVLMVLFCKRAMDELGVPVGGWTMLDDGDDCTLIVDRQYEELVSRELVRVFCEFGQELKIAKIARRIEDIEMCGCRIVRTARHTVMVLDPRRLFGKFSVSYGMQTQTRRRYRMVGQCYMAAYAGVPVIQEFASTLLRFYPKDVEVVGNWVYKWNANKEYGQSVVPVTDEARQSFREAFGVSAADQVLLETAWRCSYARLRAAVARAAARDVGINEYC